MTKHKYSKEQLETAIRETTSIRQALLYLGIKAKGGNYRIIHSAIKKFNIDISHFKQLDWAKGRTFIPKRKLEDYLENKFPITSHRLRLRLIKEKIFEHKCYLCNLSKWLDDKPIPIELDHIDGNHQNNNISNLRLLCPNCHSLTPTYRGKNKK